jgi:hypothetical protein
VFNRFEPFVVLEYLQEPILGSPRAPERRIEQRKPTGWVTQGFAALAAGENRPVDAARYASSDDLWEEALQR